MRNPCRQHPGLLFRLIKIRHKVHDILVQIRQQRLLAHLLKPGFCITHGRRPVALDGAEITVTVHQRQAFFKLLAHNHQRLIDGAVPMRMVFTHGVSHDTGAFPVRPVAADPQLVHIVEGTPLHRLQSVPHIRQSPGHDDAHGIIDIRFLHDVRIFCFYNHLFAHIFS